MTNSPNFDEVIDRIGTHSAKWDMMEASYGVSPEGGIPMWVADMDFRPPACIQAALEERAVIIPIPVEEKDVDAVGVENHRPMPGWNATVTKFIYTCPLFGATLPQIILKV